MTSNDTSGVAAAAAAAATADLVVLAIGSDLALEREGHDRLSIDFSDAQKVLITAVAAAAKPGVELWWGWPCLAGLVVWFVVVPCFLRNRL